MSPTRQILFAATCLLGAGLSARKVAPPAQATDFSAFGEDENVCRQAATSAIRGASGAQAAQRYDFAHARCMQAHLRTRMMDSYRSAAPPYPLGSPNGLGYPDAFYHIPYDTKGYGYDGFSGQP